MPVFKKFGPGDQVDNVLILEPQYDLVSGSAGWRGSPNGSASLSLYGGARRSPAGVFSSVQYQSLYPNAGQTGNPTRGEPLTASVNVVWMTNEPLSKLTDVGATRWGSEHWGTVMRLYQDYSSVNSDYITASYDNYAVYFHKDSTNVVALTGGFAGNAYPSSSAQMAAAAGMGSWGYGWLIDEATGSLTASFTRSGSPLPLQFDSVNGGAVVYGEPGPLIPGPDLSIRIASASLLTRFDGGNNFSVLPTDDLAVVYVGKWAGKPTYYGDILGKVDPGFANGWAIGGTDGTFIVFSAGPGAPYGSFVTDYTPGEWHVAVGVVDRSVGKIVFGMKSLNTGFKQIGAQTSIPAIPLTSSNNLYVGYTGWVPGNDGFNMAALYMTTGSAVASGMAANVGQVLDNVANYLGGYTPASLTSSFTMESWIKPFHGSRDRRAFTIQSRNNVFWFGMSGSSGQLIFSGANGVFATSTLAPDIANWSHAAVTYDATTYSGTLYLNMTSVGSFTMTPLTGSNHTTLHAIGNVVDGGGTRFESTNATGTVGKSFHGLIGESRVWDRARTYAQLSATFNSRITGSGLATPQMSVPFNDGPLSRVYGFPMGSGALDHARYYQGRANQFARFWGFNDRSGPTWQPNDNTRFYVPKLLAPSLVPGNSAVEPVFLSRGDDLARMLVIDVPSAFHGRQIVPGSVRITDRAYSSASYGLVRTIVDDGRGGLYVSGSMTSGSQTVVYRGMPRTLTDAHNAIGLATWSIGYLNDEITAIANMEPMWGSGSLPVTSVPFVNKPGAFGEGSRAVRLGDIAVDPGGVSSHYYAAITASLFNPSVTDDLAFAWVARFGGLEGIYDGASQIDFNRLFVKSLFGSAPGGYYQVSYYGPHYGLDGIRFEIGDQMSVGGSADAGVGSATPNEWHVGIAVMDRAAGVMRVGTKSLLTGREFVSPIAGIPTVGALTGSAAFTVGSFSNSNLDLAGLLVSQGQGSASGLSANLTTALRNFASYVMTPRSFDGGSVGWNKVGNVFYGEGLVTIKDPAVLDIGRTDGAPARSTDTLQLSFRGQSRVPVKTLMCRIDRGEFNASVNPTFYTTGSAGERLRRHSSGSIRVSTVGIYNSDWELVAVARLADPVRVRSRDRLNIKLRIDF